MIVKPDIPETKRRVIRIPLIAAQGAAAFLFLFILLLGGFFLHYRQTTQLAANTEEAALETVQQKNDDQTEQIQQLAKTTASLQANLEKLNALDAEIRQIINNEAAPTPERSSLIPSSGNFKGQGGPLVQPDLNELTQLTADLQVTVAQREQSLLELKQAVLARQVRLATTPSIWPTMGDITSRFGWRNSPWGLGSDFHPGMDIANNAGTPIFATADGTVVKSGWNGGYGNLVQIDHGNNIATLYGHNSQIIVSLGDVVKKGQVIAYMGSTGNSTGPHCHYEVRVNDSAVNPESFLFLK